MTIEEMKTRKRELGYSNLSLAECSGVPVGTLQKIFSGATKAPRRDTLLALERALQQKEQSVSSTGLYDGRDEETPGPMMKEQAALYGAPPEYKKQGSYTLEDYLALPEDQRVELIDGFIYDMAAPTTGHQAIGGFIYKMLLDHVLAHGGSCMPLMSPVDVQLDEDDKTIVQPDVLIVCDRKRFQNGRVFGAPDFLAEVLSPSTRRKDMTLKHYKYARAGVREYWIIDPEKKKVVVYDLEHCEIPVVYGFQDKVPVRIWNNECEIDFSLIMQHTAFLYEV